MRAWLVPLVLLLALPGCVTNPFVAPERPEAPPVTFEALRFEVDVQPGQRGAFVVIAFPNETPKTWAHVKGLVERGYYDGREFTRVIPGFVIQQVDRAGGATDDRATIPLEGETQVGFSAGALGIARGSDPNSGGPEFFVMDFATSRLYRNYTAWGQVVEGLDVVHAAARVQSVRSPAGNAPIPEGVPLAVFDQEAVIPPVITKATVTSVTLPGDVAAQYPLLVGPTVVKDAMRVTLEWPRNLDEGREATMSWYVYTSPDAPAPDAASFSVWVEGPGLEQPLPVRHDPADARIVHVQWEPPARGNYTMRLRNATGELAAVAVPVPFQGMQP